jgi:hypothetical protein
MMKIVSTTHLNELLKEWTSNLTWLSVANRKQSGRKSASPAWTEGSSEYTKVINSKMQEDTYQDNATPDDV